MQVKCTKKFRDKHNKIIGYRIEAANGQAQDVKAERLKEVIASGNLNVINLTLTKDDRLVDKTEKQPKSASVTDNTPQSEQLIINKEMKVIEEICNRLGIAYNRDHTEIETECRYPPCVKYESPEMQLTLDTADIFISVYNNNHWDITLDVDNGLEICENNFMRDKNLIESINYIKSIKDKFNMTVSEYRKNPDILCDIAGAYIRGAEGFAYTFGALRDYVDKLGMQNSFETHIMNKIKRLNIKDNRDKLKKRVIEINKEVPNTSASERVNSPATIDELLLLCIVTNVKPNMLARVDIELFRTEFDFNVEPKNKMNVTASELSEIIKSGYNTFLKYICLNEPLIIDFEDVLYRLDTSLYERIGIELLKADEELNKRFKQNGTFSLSWLQLDVSNKRVYDQLAKVLNDKNIQADYQYNAFISSLANSINSRPATYLDIPKYNG